MVVNVNRMLIFVPKDQIYLMISSGNKSNGQYKVKELKFYFTAESLSFDCILLIDTFYS